MLRTSRALHRRHCLALTWIFAVWAPASTKADGCDLVLPAAAVARDDGLGSAVAASGPWLAVGAPGDDATGRGSGAVRMYYAKGGKWAEALKLHHPLPRAFDGFGRAVAIAGDQLVVGAPGSDRAGANAGAALVFTLAAHPEPDGVGVELFVFDHFEGDELGSAVAIDAGWILVGSPLHDDPVGNAGAAFLLERRGGEWREAAKLLSPEPSEEARFGSSLAIWGDRVAVGAPGARTPAGLAGAVYVFSRAGAEWRIEAVLSMPGSGVNPRWGSAVSLRHDRLLAGAPGDDRNGPAAGLAAIFRHVGGAWGLEAVLSPAPPATDDAFGSAVALGDSLAAVGAPGDSERSYYAGAAVLFAPADGSWGRTDTLTASSGLELDHLGGAVALGSGWLVAGARTLDAFAPNGGGVLFFGLGTGDCDGDGARDACEIAAGDSADANGDGFPDDCQSFRRGDVDASGSLRLTDAVLILGALFEGGPTDPCPLASDANDDGRVNISDALYLAFHLFRGGPAPPLPGPSECGVDPTPGPACLAPFCTP